MIGTAGWGVIMLRLGRGSFETRDADELSKPGKAASMDEREVGVAAKIARHAACLMLSEVVLSRQSCTATPSFIRVAVEHTEGRDHVITILGPEIQALEAKLLSSI